MPAVQWKCLIGWRSCKIMLTNWRCICVTPLVIFRYCKVITWHVVHYRLCDLCLCNVSWNFYVTIVWRKKMSHQKTLMFHKLYKLHRKLHLHHLFPIWSRQRPQIRPGFILDFFSKICSTKTCIFVTLTTKSNSKEGSEDCLQRNNRAVQYSYYQKNQRYWHPDRFTALRSQYQTATKRRPGKDAQRLALQPVLVGYFIDFSENEKQGDELERQVSEAEKMLDQISACLEDISNTQLDARRVSSSHPLDFCLFQRFLLHRQHRK